MSDKRFVQGSGINAFNGNELIVKGALESKVGLMAGYPGSPVAEVFTILEENAEILRECGLWAEMTNDESQGAAALNGALDVGVNAVAVMKSVGLNVAADPINIINYADKLGLSGKRGGALVVCGDDPHASSTQVAGDSRQLMEHLKMAIIEPSTPQEVKDWIGVIAGGISDSYLEKALWELGLDQQFPILKPAGTYPLEPEIVGEFSKKVENIIVVEEKSPAIENQVKTILDDLVQDGKISSMPRVWGKFFPQGDGFPEESGITPSTVIEKVGGLLLELGDPAAKIDQKKIHSELDLLAEIKAYGLLVPPRSPGFCAGCPHRETLSAVHSLRDTPEHKDIFAHGDIGCYSMSFLPPFGEMHNLTAMSVGGAGGRGMDPFVTNKKYALMGNSTFFWRGMTAISNSIKEGQDILYIIRENKNTAMTGHQPTPESGHNIMGDKTTAQDIESIVRAMGQDQIYVRKMPPSNREKYMKELDKAFSMPGTKVVIADKECGITFHKRKRAERNKIIDKQGYIPRETFINISQEVCENCRECTKNTGCPGLTIIDTDYGEKIGIDQSTCVSDTYCTKIMACPSFEKVVVTRHKPPISRVKKIPLDNIPPPVRHEFTDTWSAFISGVGGMGVGVLSSTLARAGTKEGYTVKFNDKKGLAIRNGAVSAHINYAKGNAKISTIVPNGKADLLLGLDMLEAERSLVYASRARTTAVVNSSTIPTIPMLAGMMNYPTDVEDNIRKHTNSDEYLSGRIGEISELYYGNKLFTNIILLGMAFQRGLIPVSEKNLVDAIMETVSPSQRARNTEAFELGRKFAAEPEFLEFKNIVADGKILRLFGAKESYMELLARKSNTIAHSYWMWWKGASSAEEYRTMVEEAVAKMNLDEETNRNLARRVYDMIMWGGLDHARRYVDRILEVFNVDRPEKNYAATKAAILNLAKVSLIKDEIYTPLLLTDDEKLERDKIRYNIDEENGDKITYEHINRPEFEVFGRQLRFNLPGWLAHNWLMNLFKHAKFTRGILTRWGWHKKELGFRDWYNEQVIGFFLKTAPTSYELALRVLRVINDPYRPNEFAVTGFREIIYPKMEKARKEFEQLIGSSPPLPEIPVLAS